MALMMVAGVPIGFSLGLAGMLGLFLRGGPDLTLAILDTSSLSSVTSYELITLPLFLLMAEFVMASGIAHGLFKAAAAWVGHLRGGLAIATALTGAGFAAICGSSTASAATLASTSLPALKDQGYDSRMAAGVVAVSGTLAILIPPSLALVLFGIIAEVNVAKLLVAGIIPGLLVTLTIIATILFLVWQDPTRAPTSKAANWSERVKLLSGVLPMLLLFGMIVGVIYFGLTTPTEAAAFGAVGAFAIAVARRCPASLLYRSVVRASFNSCMISTIIMGAHIFGYYIALTQVTPNLTNWIASLPVSPWVVLAILLSLLILLGFFMDQIAIMVLTVPVMLPIVIRLGYDPIWFGVLFVVVAEVGLLTPPVGLNCFVVSRSSGQPVEEVFHGIWPHVIAHVIIVGVFLAFPALITWLPSLM
jgi:tripartite ATP-independent transporter DctM subunit